jgi:DNA-binding cell septation regulator SpoVG
MEMESKKVTVRTENSTQAPSIWFRFDGPITQGNRVSLRTLGKTIDHLQSAIDRAYLDVKYDNVFKYQKLKEAEYEDVEFIAMAPEEGSYIQEAIAKISNTITKGIVDRLNAALTNAYEKTNSSAEVAPISIRDQATQRQQVFNATHEAQRYDQFVEREIGQLSQAYGDRSISKEIDQILSLIRNEKNHGSVFEVSLYGSKPGSKLTFDHERATRFHHIVSERRIGKPLILDIEIRSLDAGRASTSAQGKVKNLHSGQECSIQIPDPKVFGKLAQHLRKVKRKRLQVVACPVYEYDAWDPKAGDLIVIAFLGVVDDFQIN